ncbi:DUF1592 domain-containing protein [Pelagicoccus mobilis]|uniref:DUF1592 domain-containing protein n=1 Tax=Pelagicoccus mobilis TaxID=415221 RepID=A0A934S1P2_9BACT|nr:DUF1592 domain-containing protein [Pelagicoccus mobilis]MBK1878986.1 DUF1592 domain-containing protein [Pelagicoccus mobilis]
MPLSTPFCKTAIGLLALQASVSAWADSSVLQSYRNEVEPIFDNYCYDCHGYGESKGGVTLDEFTKTSILDHDLWKRVLRNTRAEIMPPLEESEGHIPPEEERKAILDWIKRRPFGIDSSNPDPGDLTIQRLNREEYKNTIRDLMGIKFETYANFPADNSGEGFDNIGDLLTLSPMMLEKYLDAAIQIVEEAVPTEPFVMQQNRYDGTEIATLLGIPDGYNSISEKRVHVPLESPVDFSKTLKVQTSGKYKLALDLKTIATSSNDQDSSEQEFTVELIVDEQHRASKRQVFRNGESFDLALDLDLAAGEHTIQLRVSPYSKSENEDAYLLLDQLTFTGPEAKEHWKRPDNYERFFGDGVPQKPEQHPSYTRETLRHFATKAYRRPVDDPTLERLTKMALEVASHESYTLEKGISQAIVAILASPRFLFREEEHLPPASPSEHPLIDEYALASRLSYFFWSTMPDRTLFQLAEAGELRKNLDSQITRMLKDKRSDRFMKNFAGQWLHARDIISVNINRIHVHLRDHPDPEQNHAVKRYFYLRNIPDSQRTPEQKEEYTSTRKIMISLYRKDLPELSWREQNAMREETEQYFEYIIREDRPISEFIDSDYAFLNETTAKHYGIDGVTGRNVRRVNLPENSPRGGVLTQGTLLAYTSNPTRTSPVKRGVFILENILGTPPAAPPPNIPSLEDVASERDLENMSLRDTLAIHREKALCASCHNRMDPLGLALENFNALGIWRDSELDQEIDSSGTLITGESFNSIQELKRILATDRLHDFYHCFAEKMLTYALGRGLDYYDTHTLDQLVETLEQNEGRPSSLFRAIVHSAPFQKTRHPDFQSP